MDNPRRRGRGSSFTTRSGRSLKLNRSLSARMRENRYHRATQRAARLSTLPKNRWKRMAYRLQPKRLYHYWFSREGGIMALKIGGVAVVIGFFLLIGLFAYLRKDLPNIKDISGDKLGGSITYYDRTGKTVLWQDYNAVKRIPVAGDQISPYIKNATIAIEDKDFYHHGAFDVRGIARAASHDLFGGGGGVQGGSTITQQLVKLNEQWTNNRTVTRKVKELILAVELEREYSKADILTGYLNIAPYGGVEYGVESAARDYFHSDAKNLSLAQAAMLASIPRAPSYYSPYSSPKYNTSASENLFNKAALLNRQHYVLDQMVKQHMISADQANQAKKVNVLAKVYPLKPKFQGIKAPYFVLAAKQQMEEKYGATTVQRGGWRVTTTLDLKAQNDAENIVAQNLQNVQNNGGDEEATVAEDVHTGQIMALVGGVDFTNPDHGQVNYAAQALIPPGSSFKPYDYATLINNSNAGAGSVLYDIQQPILDPATKAGYPCTDKSLPPPHGSGNCLEDYDFRYPGPLSLRYAIAGSRNVPAVKAMIQAGVNKTISTASQMMAPDNPPNTKAYNCYQDEALTKVGQCYPSAAIGDGAYLHLDDHVNGLATLARLGQAIPRTFILKIDDSGGKTVDKFTQPKPKQVIKPDAAYIVDNMLSDPRATYLPVGYKFQDYNGWKFAVKTGTTNDNFDGLMTSWSTKYAVVSWVGYHTRNVALTSGAMEYLTEPLTRGMMEDLHSGQTPVNWKEPAGIQHLPAFVVRNHVGVGSEEPSPSTDIYPSWYKPRGNTGSAVIDRVSNKLATACTPPAAKETVGNVNANAFSIDEFVNGGAAATSHYNTTSKDDVHHCDDTKPAVTLTVSSASGGQYTLTATVSQGSQPLSSSQFPGNVTFSINGSSVGSCGLSAAATQTCSRAYKPTSSGAATVMATVTDSVLYQNSSSQSVNFTAAGAATKPKNKNLNITNPANGQKYAVAGGSQPVSWSGGTGPYTVSVSKGGSGCSTNGIKCSVTLPPNQSNIVILVEDSDGHSSQITVSTTGP